MSYSIWVWTSLHTAAGDSPVQWIERFPHITEEWEAYWHAARESLNYGYATLRNQTGDIIYAVFAHGNRIWHTLETTP